MKRTILAGTLVSMAFVGTAGADHIAIFSDPNSYDCVRIPPAYETYTWYVVHRFSGGAVGSAWKVDDQTGQFQAGITVPGGFLWIGSPWYDGIHLAYGGCLVGDFVVVHLNYFGFPVPAASCGSLTIVPAATKASVEYTNCDFVEHPATGGSALNNADGTCCCSCPHAVEAATWGGIKALYR